MANQTSIRAELLQRFSTLSLADANEAETRKKIIDEILEQILGWSIDDISYEERVSEDGTTKFADYILRTVSGTLLIEAKRVGAAFTHSSTKRREKLSSRFLEGAFGEAVIQARDYCRKKSIPFAAVTNGHQWVVFPAVRTDQVSFADSSAIIFSSLEDILGSDFDYFFSLLSRDGVVNGALGIELTGRSGDQIEERRLNKFFQSTAQIQVNPVYPLIENEINTAFSEAVNFSESSIIEKCYVRTADRTKFDNRIKMHLAKREAVFSSRPPNPMRSRDAKVFDNALARTMESGRPLAILVLGPVGAGKTTYLHYTRKVSSSAYFDVKKDLDYPHWIYVDFRGYKTADSPSKFIFEKIFEYMQEDPYFSEFERGVRTGYKAEIAALRTGPLALIARRDEAAFESRVADIIQADFIAKEPYVKKLLKGASEKVPVFLVIDNLDQFESSEVQRSVFSDAIALASELPLSLVIAMRESTYVKYKNSPTFDAFDFDPIQLEPPDIKPVLSRRFFLATELTKGKRGKFTALNGANFDVADLSIFVDIVKSSVLSSYVGDYIDILAVRDVRLALRLTRQFLERGYTDPAKALNHHNSGTTYTLPRHEAFRSLLLGTQPVYSEEHSAIGNPFDSRLGNTSSQMLRLYLLNALVRCSSSDSFQYIDGPTIRGHLRTLGISDEHTLQALRDLSSFRMIHTASHTEPDFHSNYYPSRYGGYVVRELIGSFTFVENILMDTFISSNDVWSGLFELSKGIRETRDPLARLKLRIERAQRFYAYATSLYDALLIEAQRRSLPSEWCANPLADSQRAFRSDCVRALRSAKNGRLRAQESAESTRKS